MLGSIPVSAFPKTLNFQISWKTLTSDGVETPKRSKHKQRKQPKWSELMGLNKREYTITRIFEFNKMPGFGGWSKFIIVF